MKLFDFVPPGSGGLSGRVYDISPLDRRFIVGRPVTSAATVDVSVVLNWFEELRELVPLR
jgi:hypothetical protein